jgi:hypothetical protein
MYNQKGKRTKLEESIQGLKYFISENTDHPEIEIKKQEVKSLEIEFVKIENEFQSNLEEITVLVKRYLALDSRAKKALEEFEALMPYNSSFHQEFITKKNNYNSINEQLVENSKSIYNAVPTSLEFYTIQELNLQVKTINSHQIIIR